VSRILRYCILIGSVALGLWIGRLVEPIVLEPIYKCAYIDFCDPDFVRKHEMLHFVLIGLITSSFAVIAGWVLRLPMLTVAAVIYAASIPYQPMVSVFRYGDSVSRLMVHEILWFQAPFFVGAALVLLSACLVGMLLPRRGHIQPKV
jgi:hypothetical protein